ncbi:unnamed protein product [Didymodactylos carnosus]|uniref:histone deacetylase n=1 Tax=Didymodactylos carnosus TaxID=1234261 RepID=A0A815IQB6_9BILA|nr:unnamed protein product [Didymodactylos carnosus]CAF1367944.1 unnamed protein product [Didymodactylos carnosus]CAF4103293.1 unnamed protein product [Didymodactylos carnosus]CAF4251363.1 unnamed protein product [Didymodactylos carnosus]
MTNDDGTIDIWGGLYKFTENVASSEKPVRPFYVPSELPLTIASVLYRWNQSVLPNDCSIAVCPCDIESVTKMWHHTWGPSHVEQPTRLQQLYEALDKDLWEKGFRWQTISGRSLTDSELSLVHSSEFLNDFLAIEQGKDLSHTNALLNFTYANPDFSFCSVGPYITSACRVAAGSVLALTKLAISGRIQHGFALVRPAGHHSQSDKSGTFCGLNNVAIACIAALSWGAKKVLVVDLDVHRSVGTEEIFSRLEKENRITVERLLLIDIYATFGGSHKAQGPTILVPLMDEKEIGDQQYFDAFERVVLPKAKEFNPDLVLVSAGFDAAKGDAEGFQVTPRGYQELTMQLRLLGSPMIYVLEGGYDLSSLCSSAVACMNSLLSPIPR